MLARSARLRLRLSTACAKVNASRTPVFRAPYSRSGRVFRRPPRPEKKKGPGGQDDGWKRWRRHIAGHDRITWNRSRKILARAGANANKPGGASATATLGFSGAGAFGRGLTSSAGNDRRPDHFDAGAPHLIVHRGRILGMKEGRFVTRMLYNYEWGPSWARAIHGTVWAVHGCCADIEKPIAAERTDLSISLSTGNTRKNSVSRESEKNCRSGKHDSTSRVEPQFCLS